MRFYPLNRPGIRLKDFLIPDLSNILILNDLFCYRNGRFWGVDVTHYI